MARSSTSQQRAQLVRDLSKDLATTRSSSRSSQHSQNSQELQDVRHSFSDFSLHRNPQEILLETPAAKEGAEKPFHVLRPSAEKYNPFTRLYQKPEHKSNGPFDVCAAPPHFPDFTQDFEFGSPSIEIGRGSRKISGSNKSKLEQWRGASLNSQPFSNGGETSIPSASSFKARLVPQVTVAHRSSNLRNVINDQSSPTKTVDYGSGESRKSSQERRHNLVSKHARVRDANDVSIISEARPPTVDFTTRSTRFGNRASQRKILHVEDMPIPKREEEIFQYMKLQDDRILQLKVLNEELMGDVRDLTKKNKVLNIICHDSKAECQNLKSEKGYLQSDARVLREENQMLRSEIIRLSAEGPRLRTSDQERHTVVAREIIHPQQFSGQATEESRKLEDTDCQASSRQQDQTQRWLDNQIAFPKEVAQRQGKQGAALTDRVNIHADVPPDSNETQLSTLSFHNINAFARLHKLVEEERLQREHFTLVRSDVQKQVQQSRDDKSGREARMESSQQKIVPKYSGKNHASYPAAQDDTQVSRRSEKPAEHSRRHSETSILGPRNRRHGVDLEHMTSEIIVPDITIKLPGPNAQPTPGVSRDAHVILNRSINGTQHAQPQGREGTLKVPKPIPVSDHIPRSDENHLDQTLRPSQPPGHALAIVIKRHEDALAFLKTKVSEYQKAYEATTGRTKGREEFAVYRILQRYLRASEAKRKDIYNLYDVLEGQKQAGQEMSQDEIEIGIEDEISLAGSRPQSRASNESKALSWGLDSEELTQATHDPAVELTEGFTETVEFGL
ncbi:hypothetical protein MMC21_004550 [Puttea exsequens]|nr:hypothetical protein [Puttea exsequens]